MAKKKQMESSWVRLVKHQHKKVLSETKLRGASALKEALKRSKKLYSKRKLKK